MHGLCILEPWDIEGSRIWFDNCVEFEDLYHIRDLTIPTTHQVSYPTNYLKKFHPLGINDAGVLLSSSDSLAAGVSYRRRQIVSSSSDSSRMVFCG